MTAKVRHVLTLFTALLFAAMTVVSAAAMANDRSDPMRLAYLAATGGSLQDLCGDGPASPFHCPVCHGLGEASGPDRPERELTLWLEQIDAPQDDLIDDAQASPRFHARAPPLFS